MDKQVAIIGNGWVAKAMQQLFPESVTYVREIPIQVGGTLEYTHTTEYTTEKEEINKCDIAFICVPTPNKEYVIDERKEDESGYDAIVGSHREKRELDTSAVEECIAWCECPLIVIRSTVNPGDCSKWKAKYGKHIVFQPEYLGETPQHPLLDTKNTPFLIIGGQKDDRRQLIELYQTVYNANISIRQVTLLEAEVIKLSENRAIAFKVAQCQELYDVCEKAGVDYYKIREAVYGDDPRFNMWFTFIYVERRGFNSKCIPKDVYAWCSFAESIGYEPKITRAILEKNKEWIK